MGETNWLDLMSSQNWLQEVDEANQYSSKYGLVLSKEDALTLLEDKKRTLKSE